MASTRNLRHASLAIVDGTGIPNVLVIPISSGDLAFSVSKPKFFVKNRGRLDHRRDGDQMEMDVSFSFLFETWSYTNLSSGSPSGISPVDALLKQGGASAWTTKDPNCGPYSVDLRFRIGDPCSTDITNPTSYEQLLFTQFSAEKIDFKEGAEANTINVSGKCLAMVPTRTAAP